jgi:hypothetical protein
MWIKKCTRFAGDTKVVGICGFFLSQNQIEVYLIAFLPNQVSAGRDRWSSID